VKTLTAALVLVAISAPQLAAQDSVRVKPGDRVRIVSPGHGVLVQGTLVRLAGDTITLQEGRSSTAYSLAGGRRLETPVARRSMVGRSALQWSLLFAALGGMAGALPVAGQRLHGLAGGVAVGGVAGLLVGGLFGAFNDREVWTPVTPGDAHIGLAPAPIGSVALRASVAF
jgi:hypothetical protein